MKRKIILNAVLATVLIATAVMVVLANRDIDRIYGGMTKQVDPAQFSTPDGRVVIKNVNVLSPDGSQFIANQYVVIQDGLIVAVDDQVEAAISQHTIDGTGKFLIPGLTDSHVHLFKSRNDLLLYLANGVTQIREMIGEEGHLEWRKQIRDGGIGPEMFIASPRIGSFGTLEGFFMEWSQGFLNITNAEEAKREVARLHQEGYDAVKIYSQINAETYQAITQEARSLGLKVVGHVPWSVTMDSVYEGQDEVAHLEELMNAINREFGGFSSDQADEFLMHVDQRSDAIAQHLAERGIAVTTTLWLVESFVRQKFELDELLKEVELTYENPGISEWTPRVPQGGLGWLPEVNRYQIPEGLSESRYASIRKYWETYAKACQMIVAKLVKYDVLVVAGTDTNLPPMVPGFSLHDEFVSMHKASMSASQILRSATLSPGAWLENNTGIITPGFKANLVLLDKNPLLDIENTRTINTVVMAGRVFDRTLLDRVLAAVEGANASSRTVSIDHYLH